jgi:hypothetical protein
MQTKSRQTTPKPPSQENTTAGYKDIKKAEQMSVYMNISFYANSKCTNPSHAADDNSAYT